MNQVRRMVALGAALAMVFLGTVLMQTASATVLSCGSTVAVTTTLTADVGPCPPLGPAITITGNNVIPDLNGHRVFGVAGANGNGSDPYVGIYVPSRTGARIVNGRVSDFDTGIYLEFGGSHRIERLHVHDNIGPLDGSGIFGEGIQLFESDNNVINANQVIHNGTFGGITVFDSHGTRITNNVVQGNNVLQTNSLDTGGGTVPGRHRDPCPDPYPPEVIQLRDLGQPGAGQRP